MSEDSNNTATKAILSVFVCGQKDDGYHFNFNWKDISR
jgi:hypothetical protein